MPRAEGQKAKLLVLKQIFERKTDEEHMLSVPQLLSAFLVLHLSYGCGSVVGLWQTRMMRCGGSQQSNEVM